MPCYYPIKAYKLNDPLITGKRQLVFNLSQGCNYVEQMIPCGHCIGCRLQKTQQWAIRCVHEASLYDDNSFITLTYDEKFVEKNYSLENRDFPLFMKRLRKYFAPKKIRFFHCGEYGDKLRRPHHHACLFNLKFPDEQIIFQKKDIKLNTSKILSELWPYGFSTVGEMNYQTAAYVARYTIKKIGGEKAKDHYQGRKPEYATMSRKPGLGLEWIKQYKTDVYPHDFVVNQKGKKLKPPKYYDKYLENLDNLMYTKIKQDRVDLAKNNPDNSHERLYARRIVKQLKLKELERSI